MVLNTDQGPRSIKPEDVRCVYVSPLREHVIPGVIVLRGGREIAVTAPRGVLRWLEARARLSG